MTSRTASSLHVLPARKRGAFATRIAGTLLALASLAGPAAASIAKPPSGAQFGMHLGGVINVTLKNSGGCTFDMLAQSSTPGVVSLSRTMGTNLKSAAVAIEAVGIGSTTVSIMSMNGTCPPATHTYQVEVSPDWKALSKDFSKLAKAEFKDFKLDVGASFKTYKEALSAANVEYKNGTLSDDELHGSFHFAAVDLRKAWTLSAVVNYADVVGGGTQILADAAAEIGDAPPTFFAGGCGSFDWFQDSVCSKAVDFHDAFDLASKKGIKAFEKSGAPRFGQWNVLPPLFAAGALYPGQAMDFPLSQSLTGPLTITTMPARNEAGDDGRVLVSGIGLTSASGQLEVSLTYFEAGQAPVVWTDTPDITGGAWDADFSGLPAGAYLMAVGYTGDAAEVEVPLSVVRTTTSF